MKQPIEIALDSVEWRGLSYDIAPSMISDGLPHVTHEGILDFCGFKFRVYRLSSGERIIDADDLKEFFQAD